MRKSILIVLCVLMVLSLLTSGMAVAAEPESLEFARSEYDAYKELKMKSDKELKEIGLSNEQIKELRKFNYAKELKKRAQLSEKELKGMGYNDEQIAMLKKFTGTEEEVYALSATLYMSSTLDYYEYWAQTTYTLSYEWWWSFKPVFEFTDIIGYGWGSNFIIDRNYTYHKVNYKDTYGNHRGAYFYEVRTETAQASASSKFPMVKNINGFSCWAYKGVGELQLYHPDRITIFQVIIKYGHTTLDITPGLSRSGPSVEEQTNYISRADTIQN